MAVYKFPIPAIETILSFFKEHFDTHIYNENNDKSQHRFYLELKFVDRAFYAAWYIKRTLLLRPEMVPIIELFYGKHVADQFPLVKLLNEGTLPEFTGKSIQDLAYLIRYCLKQGHHDQIDAIISKYEDIRTYWYQQKLTFDERAVISYCNRVPDHVIFKNPGNMFNKKMPIIENDYEPLLKCLIDREKYEVSNITRRNPVVDTKKSSEWAHVVKQILLNYPDLFMKHFTSLSKNYYQNIILSYTDVWVRFIIDDVDFEYTSILFLICKEIRSTRIGLTNKVMETVDTMKITDLYSLCKVFRVMLGENSANLALTYLVKRYQNELDSNINVLTHIDYVGGVAQICQENKYEYAFMNIVKQIRDKNILREMSKEINDVNFARLFINETFDISHIPFTTLIHFPSKILISYSFDRMCEYLSWLIERFNAGYQDVRLNDIEILHQKLSTTTYKY